ncbi:nucleotide triphosphate diphosphatase NUDT15 [Shewanella marina]|uniref:nucleotide triphosphate diphosphatase NUDT15 n=1 Tax=Shewanella marina TaxID=487319 RepID=UPI00046FA5BA|nr:NUDIX hydrolase [Shewanella marina]
MTTQQVKVGVGVIIMQDGKILLGKRQGSHGAGTWACPGGHIEFGESIETCAAREVLEETGLVISELKHADFTNNVIDDDKHYVTVFMQTRTYQGEPQVLEPNKCECWHWFDWHAMPTPLFSPLADLYQSGFEPA